jgi:hypothetical protein
MANPAHAQYPSQDARLAFGRTLTLWMERGGWSHDICQRWGKAAGFVAIADSTFNRLQRGRIEQPYPITFIQLGMINSRLADQDYSGLEDPALAARVAQQRPITHDDGTPWTAADFFAHFIGELEPPAWGRERPLPSLDQAVSSGAAVVELFRATAETHALTLPEAWKGFEDFVASQTPKPLNAEEMELLRSVLSGWITWTPEQLHGLIDLDGDLRPLQALSAWQTSLDVPAYA